LEQQAKDGIRTGSKAFITRPIVLGKMFETKQQSWDGMISSCPHLGEHKPQSLPEFIEWLRQLKPLSVRLAIGYTKEKALRMKTALKTNELALYLELLAWERIDERKDERPVPVEGAAFLEFPVLDEEDPF